MALIDIRDLTDDAYGLVYSIRQQHVGIEVVLINKPDNVAASIAGMKAGASDEVIVPFDIDTLKAIINDASIRAQADRTKKRGRTLLSRFSEAMMAATFAQAGDFDGAMNMLGDPDLQLPTEKASKKKGGS